MNRTLRLATGITLACSVTAHARGDDPSTSGIPSIFPPFALAAEPAATPASQESTSSQNAANNPLTPKITINLHDYYTPEYEGIDGDGNQFLLRGLIPHKIGGVPQLLRFTQPVVTVPDGDDGHASGISDLTLMNLFVFPKKPFEFGIGPLLVIPMGPESTSTEKWQLGVAGIAIAPQEWGLFGALLTFQQSFAGDDDRDDVTLATLQPLVIYNLPDGFYLRSTATWNWDLNNGTYYVPVGLGVGKVWDSDNVTVNAFIEPQLTVFQDNDAAPEWQIFFGVNFQFPLRR